VTCPYDELAARWAYWFRFSPMPTTLSTQAYDLIREATTRITMYNMHWSPEDMLELAMALADGSET
jgi:hypothetical protein